MSHRPFDHWMSRIPTRDVSLGRERMKVRHVWHSSRIVGCETLSNFFLLILKQFLRYSHLYNKRKENFIEIVINKQLL